MSTDFVAFGIGAGANVKDLAAYQADPSTQQGFSTGLASSASMNRVFRQATFIAAGLANFVANELGINVADDSNLPNFINNLTNAISALIAATQGHFYTGVGSPQGTQQGIAGGPANPPDLYENTATGDIWVCTGSGTASTAQWRLVSTPQSPGVAQIGSVTTNHLTSWASAGAVQDAGILASNVMQIASAISNGRFPVQGASGFTDSGAVINNVVVWGGTSTGSANAQVMTATNPPFGALVSPTLLIHKAGFTNTGALTLNVNSLGVQQTRKAGGSGPIALTGSEVVQNNLVGWCWDGSVWQLLFSFSVGALIEPSWGTVSANLTNASAAPNTSVSVNTTNIYLSNTGGNASILAVGNRSFTCDLTINGVNGLDTGSRGSSTGYYIHLISDGNGNFGTIATLNNLSVPTLPSGWGYYAPVGWVPTDSSANIYRFIKNFHTTQYVPTAGTNTASCPILARGPLTNSLIPLINVSGAKCPLQTVNIRLQLQSDAANTGSNYIVQSGGQVMATAVTAAGGLPQIVTFDTNAQASSGGIIVTLTSANAIVYLVGWDAHF